MEGCFAQSLVIYLNNLMNLSPAEISQLPKLRVALPEDSPLPMSEQGLVLFEDNDKKLWLSWLGIINGLLLCHQSDVVVAACYNNENEVIGFELETVENFKKHSVEVTPTVSAMSEEDAHNDLSR